MALLKSKVGNTTYSWKSDDIRDAEISAINNVYGAKNIIPFPYISTFPREFGQVTLTCDKGKVTLNGTSTYEGQFTYVLVAKSSTVFDEASNALPIFTHDGTYIISNGTNVRLQMNIYRNSSKINTIICTDAEIQFNALSTDTIEIGIPIDRGETFTNSTCYPMIRDAHISDSTWTPYAMTNGELTKRVCNYTLTDYANVNIDDFLEPGFYQLVSGIAGTPIEGNFSTLIVNGNNVHSRGSQIWISMYGSMYFRSRHHSSWESWKLVTAT